MSTLPAAAAGSKEADFLSSVDGLLTSLPGLRLRRDSLVRETGDRERRSKRDAGFRSGSVWSKRDRFTRGASSAIVSYYPKWWDQARKLLLGDAEARC